MLALVVFYRDFDLPQHLFADLAHRCTEGIYRVRGVEVEDAEEIFVLKEGFRLHPAAGHKGVGDADRCGFFEGGFFVVVIILLQIGIRNDAENIPPVIVPVFFGKEGRNPLKLIGKAVGCRDAVILFQHIGNPVPMLRAQLPQIDAAAVLAPARVGNVKNIPEPRPIAAGVNEGDAFAPTPNIPAHAVIPEIIVGAGGGVRALHIDHKLFVIGVLIEPGGGGQERRPILIPMGDLPCGLFRHLCVGL